MYQQQPAPWQPVRPPAPPRRGPSTRTVVLIAVGVGIVVLIFGVVAMLADPKAFQDQPVAEPPSSAQALPTGPRSDAQILRDDDGDTYPVIAYQEALDRLKPRCIEPQHNLAAFAWFGSQDLAKHGITEPALSMLGHMYDTAPAGQKVSCQGLLAAYLVLREKS